MDIEKLSVRVRRNQHGPATEALDREGLERLVNDGFHALTVLNSEITPDSIREYVEVNVRIDVFVGRYLEPSVSDLEAALERSRLEERCAEHNGAADLDDAPAFRP